MPFTTIQTEGGLLPADLLEDILAGEALGQDARDFRLPRGARLSDEIAAAWADARAYWNAFQRGLRRLPEDDAATTVTRELWLLPLLRSLGYDSVTYSPRAAVVGNSTYAISHYAGPSAPECTEGAGPPVHLAGCRIDMDRRPPTGRPRLSPHALLQEYLNRTEQLWGLVSNGLKLRLLRTSALMTRPSYVEFDLQPMLAGEHFSDFTLLYRLLHRSRLPRAGEGAAAASAHECWLEQYYQQALEQGGRVREHLRDGVERALLILGRGFLAHPRSADLCGWVDPATRSGPAAPVYYRQLLRLVYRLLFLMVSEERNLVGPEDDAQAAIYRRYYSVTRLRDLAEGYLAQDAHSDLWEGVKQTFRLYAESDIAARLGMAALDGDLFGPDALPDLEGAALSNYDLLRALRHLSLYRDDRVLRRVNYAALDVEELGSVYESLLDYHPVIRAHPGGLTFDFVQGSERKTTGSYYTRPELVNELIESALVPVIEDRLADVKRQTSGVTRHTSHVTRHTSGSPDASRMTHDASRMTPDASRVTPDASRVTHDEQALLSIRVCDPACGSGAFLLAAARRLGRALARVRTGEDHPTPTAFRRAVRDVIRTCLYGVDLNPLAVDLCKVALWLEGHNRGMPLTFLDHRIRHGDSLVGVHDLAMLTEGIPSDAYKPVSGDDKATARGLRDQNKQERKGQRTLFEEEAPPDLATLAAQWQQLAADPDEDVAAIRRKHARYQQVRDRGTLWWQVWTACNLWTAPFFARLTPDQRTTVPTTADVRAYLSHPGAAHGQKVGLANELAVQQRFFHWPLEFPDVFADPRAAHSPSTGFDVILSNPPWEQIQLQEKEFFATRDPTVAEARNKAVRTKLIKQLSKTRPALWSEYRRAKHDIEALTNYLRASERYPLTARGRINTYQVFAELLTRLLSLDGRMGVILPTGIVTDYYTQNFFAELVDSQQLISIYDFENREALFPEVHRSYKFSLLTVGAKAYIPTFVFFATRLEHLADETRRFTLTRDDIARINPNTRTCPIFRTRPDADLTRTIYRRVPVLENEAMGENPWDVSFRQGLFNMSSDSGLFRTREQLEAQGGVLRGNHFQVGDDAWLPLYEAKMIWHFDHRFGSYAGRTERGFTNLDPVTLEQYTNPQWVPLPFYWVSSRNVTQRLGDWERAWLLGFRDVTNATNERTAIFSLLPRVGVGHTMPLVFVQENALHTSTLLANLNALPFDYVVRQKVGGVHLSYNLLRQFPVLSPTAYSSNDLAFIVPRVLELVYTAWDLAPFADDVCREADPAMRARLTRQWEANAAATPTPPSLTLPPQAEEGDKRDLRFGLPSPAGGGRAGDGGAFPHPPFMWDEDRRAVLRAELDAHYARLYGLTEEELRYVLDPADVYGEDFPGETFRVLKEKEIKAYGEYRTRRLVLEAFDKLKGTDRCT